jgi:hypothetical protein
LIAQRVVKVVSAVALPFAGVHGWYRQLWVVSDLGERDGGESDDEQERSEAEGDDSTEGKVTMHVSSDTRDGHPVQRLSQQTVCDER